MKFTTHTAIAFIAASWLCACASTPSTILSPEQIDLSKAKELQEAGRYDLAIEQYTNIKNKYPLSREAITAELELAETFYLQGSYTEARAAFEVFNDLHPTHELADFVSYRTAMSYYQEIPKTIDRDMTRAAEAIHAFDEFIQAYPRSKHVEDAKKRRMEAKKKLAEKENYIAHFYLRQKRYKAAAGRYQALLKDYAGLGYDEKALYHLGLCYHKLDQKQQANEVLSLFLKRYASSPYADNARKMLDKP